MTRAVADPTAGYSLECTGITLRLPECDYWGFTLTRLSDGATCTGNYGWPEGMSEAEWHSRIKFLMIGLFDGKAVSA